MINDWLQEKDDSNELYYIESGRVAVLHRKTMSYVTDLNVRIKSSPFYKLKTDKWID